MSEKIKVFARIRAASDEDEVEHPIQRRSLSPKKNLSPVRSRSSLEKSSSKQSLLSSQSGSSKSLVRPSLSGSSSQSKIPRLASLSINHTHSVSSAALINRPSYISNVVVKVDDEVIKVLKPEGHTRITDKLFLFDKIFSEEATTQELYSSVSSSIIAALNGHNSTVVSIGPAKTGKTHTMFGDKASSGIIPKALFELFREVEVIRNTNFDVYFYLEVSFVELYNNKIVNLIKDSASDGAEEDAVVNIDDSINMSDFGSSALAALKRSPSKLQQFSPTTQQSVPNSSSRFAPLPQHDKVEIRESKDMGVFLSGTNLRTHVAGAEDAVRLLIRSAKNRNVRKMNSYISSRFIS
jgi:hypothetical protein